ncbi:UNKNOWN [Stylonychia lemnae]|uniref:Uncharacterized protein n=1 Tax=Stylonychia lemnae TaxID=5949 RepID=A0A078B5P3_STYLE|nr:UNKNOWN [Stylonychia lemnae]|eukprot:CDW89840.1 UNKNOWN [Stylonychia lemnae]
MRYLGKGKRATKKVIQNYFAVNEGDNGLESVDDENKSIEKEIYEYNEEDEEEDQDEDEQDEDDYDDEDEGEDQDDQEEEDEENCDGQEEEENQEDCEKDDDQSDGNIMLDDIDKMVTAQINNRKKYLKTQKAEEGKEQIVKGQKAEESRIHGDQYAQESRLDKEDYELFKSMQENYEKHESENKLKDDFVKIENIEFNDQFQDDLVFEDMLVPRKPSFVEIVGKRSGNAYFEIDIKKEIEYGDLIISDMPMKPNSTQKTDTSSRPIQEVKQEQNADSKASGFSISSMFPFLDYQDFKQPSRSISKDQGKQISKAKIDKEFSARDIQKAERDRERLTREHIINQEESPFFFEESSVFLRDFAKRYNSIDKLSDSFRSEGLFPRRTSREHIQERLSKMKSPDDSLRQNASIYRNGFLPRHSGISNESENQRKREVKEQRKIKERESKLRILKAHYLNDDNKLKVDSLHQDSTLSKIKTKLLEYNNSKTKVSQNKLNFIVDGLCAQKQLTKAEREKELKQNKDQIQIIQKKFNLTPEEAEKSLLLKKEIEMMHNVIQDIRKQGQSKNQNYEKDDMLQNVEQFIQKLKSKSKVKKEDVSGDKSKELEQEDKEFSYLGTYEYMENVEVMFNVFIKRLEKAQQQ